MQGLGSIVLDLLRNSICHGCTFLEQSLILLECEESLLAKASTMIVGDESKKILARFLENLQKNEDEKLRGLCNFQI